MRLLCLISCLVAMPCAAAAETHLPQMEGEGPLQALTTPAEAQGWQAVGRLDTRMSFCSATLIAPDLVLTAAHCLFDPRNRRYDDEDLRFSAGLRNGQAEAIRGVARSFVHPAFRATAGRPEFGTVAYDIALLELDAPIQLASVQPIRTGPRGHVRDVVTVVSYGRDRSQHASIEEDCTILARQAGVTALSCSVIQGASGSPILRETPSGIEIASVVSAMGEWEGRTAAFAVDVETILPTLMAARGSGQPRPSGGTASIRRLTDDDGGRSQIGARFLRP